MINWLSNLNLAPMFSHHQIIRVPIFLMLIILAIELFYLLKYNRYINQLIKKVRQDQLQDDKILSTLLEKYKTGNINSFSTNTASYIEHYFSQKMRAIKWKLKLIKQSDAAFLLLGFLGSFMILLLAVLNLNWPDLNSINQIPELLLQLSPSLRSAFYSATAGIISSLVLNIANRLFSTELKLKKLYRTVEDYLYHNFQEQSAAQIEQLVMITNSIKELQNTLSSIEDVLKNTMAGSLVGFENSVKLLAELFESGLTSNKMLNSQQLASVLQKIAATSEFQEKEYEDNEQEEKMKLNHS